MDKVKIIGLEGGAIDVAVKAQFNPDGNGMALRATVRMAFKEARKLKVVTPH